MMIERAGVLGFILPAMITDFMSGKGKGRTVTVVADNTTKLDFAPQLKAKVSGDRTVKFSLDKVVGEFTLEYG